MLTNSHLKSLESLIKEIFKFATPIDKSLSEFFKSHRALTKEHRKIFVDVIYALLRNFYKVTSVTHEKDVLNQIGIILVKILKLPKPLLKNLTIINIDELERLEFATTISTQTELPTWIIERLSQSYSSLEILSIANSLSKPASLDLRVNLLKGSSQEVYEKLSSQNINVASMKYSPFGLRILDKISLIHEPTFKKGLIEIQDESSQIAGLLLAPRRGEMVVDFCSGSGGKALLFGMLMHNTGRIYTFDVNQKRLNNLTPRLARSGLSNISPKLIENENDVKVKRLHGKIDKVFVDVPCSGLGTLRRNPELKFRMNEEAILELNQKQASILKSASKLVKKGGYLVYATCSILKEENENIVTDFLNDNPEFELIPVNSVLDNIGLNFKGNFLQLLPNIHNTDGFFAALIKRK